MNILSQKTAKTILLLTLFLILAIAIFIVTKTKHSQQTDQKIITLVDSKIKNLHSKTGHRRVELHRIDFISYVDKDGAIKPVTIKSLAYNISHSGIGEPDPVTVNFLRPLIRNLDRNRYFFFNREVDYNFIFFEAIYDSNNNKILIKDKKLVENVSCIDKYNTYISYDSWNKEVLLNDCRLFNTEQEKTNYPFLYNLVEHQKKHINNLKYNDKKITGLTIQNSLQIDSNTFIIQMSGDYEGRNSLYNSVNYLAKVTRGKNEWKLTGVGYYPVMWPAFENRLFSPLDVSPDKKQVAFLASYSPDSKNELFLFTLDLDSFETRKIIDIDMNPLGLPEGMWTIFMFSPRNLKWCPASNSNIVAVHTVGELLIIDITYKKIINSFQRNSYLVNMRWNKKGDKLGILENDGVLSVYDLKTGSIKKIAKDTDYFDLIWVP